MTSPPPMQNTYNLPYTNRHIFGENSRDEIWALSSFTQCILSPLLQVQQTQELDLKEKKGGGGTARLTITPRKPFQDESS